MAQPLVPALRAEAGRSEFKISLAYRVLARENTCLENETGNNLMEHDPRTEEAEAGGSRVQSQPDYIIRYHLNCPYLKWAKPQNSHYSLLSLPKHQWGRVT